MPDTDAYREAAARLLKCQPDDLLAFRWSDEEQQFIVLAPTGQKFRYELADLEAALAPPDSPPPSGEGQGEGAIPKSRKRAKSRKAQP